MGEARPSLAPVCLWAAVCGLGAMLLYWFAPDRYGFYPRCWLQQLTGLQCPGCGGLRAVHCLLHGQWAAAWQLNPLVFVVGGWLACWAGTWVAGLWMGRPVARFFQRPAWVWGLLVLMAVFGIIRNVPVGWVLGLSN